MESCIEILFLMKKIKNGPFYSEKDEATAINKIAPGKDSRNDDEDLFSYRDEKPCDSR